MNVKWVFGVIGILIVLGSSGCKGQVSANNQAVEELTREPYVSTWLGVSSEVPADWVPFWPEGTFVRAMPNSDPTFLTFTVIPGMTIAELIPGMLAHTGIEQMPAKTGTLQSEAGTWDLYHYEIQQGFLLVYNPEYGVLAFDAALTQSGADVLAVAMGSPLEDRDQLYEHVFIPAVESFRRHSNTEASDPGTMTEHPERDYWPTEGWRHSTPAEQEIDETILAEMVAYIKDYKIPLKSVVVVRNGYVVLDEDFRPFRSLDNLKSATKSITSALVGIAIDQGYIDGVNQPVLELFPAHQVANIDTNKKAMTVEDLLTMQSGLDWPAGPCPWLDGQECADYTTQQMLEDEDSLQFLLDQPVTAEPGTKFEYIAGTSHLLSALISETSGMSALDFGLEYLFKPLGIEAVTWNEDGEGLNQGWTDIGLLPEDMAKIGFLYLNEGNWDGRQILPAEWVQASTAGHAQTGSRGIQSQYGYQWWVNPELGFYDAMGSGGNYILVMPKKDLVVVFTGSLKASLGQAQWWEGTPEELFRVYVLPAVD